MQPAVNSFDTIRVNNTAIDTNLNSSSKLNTYIPQSSNKFVKTPHNDIVLIGNPPKMSRGKKVLLALGTIATAVVGAVIAHKTISARQVTQLAEHIDFKPAKTIEEAREFAKINLGVKLKINDNLPIANFINEQLVQASNFMKGKAVLPKKILVNKDIVSAEGFKGYACWTEENHTMGISKEMIEVLNVLSEKSGGHIISYLKQLIADSTISNEFRECALQQLMVIPHELGHANHFAQCESAKKGLMDTLGSIKANNLKDTSITQQFLEDIKNTPILQKILRPQAQTAPAEFCADKFAYDVLGIKCVPEIEELAIKYNAPKPL